MKYSKIKLYTTAAKLSAPLIFLSFIPMIAVVSHTVITEQAMSIISNIYVTFLVIYYVLVIPVIVEDSDFIVSANNYTTVLFNTCIFAFLCFGKMLYSVITFFSHEMPKGVEMLTLQNIIVSSLIATVIIAIEVQFLKNFFIKK